MVSKDHTKISVDKKTHDLIGQIAEAQDRTMAGQVRHWANTDAKKLSIGTKIVTKPHIQIAPTEPGKVNINVVE